MIQYQQNLQDLRESFTSVKHCIPYETVVSTNDLKCFKCDGRHVGRV